MIVRRLLILVSLALATIAFADKRPSDNGTRPANGATVTGTVDAVSGNLIQLAGGNITIDASDAEIRTVKGKAGSIADVEVGSIVFAVLKTADVAANAPLPASAITVTRLPDATLFGPVQSVDTSANTLTLLGRTIHITSDTSFGGILKKRDADKPSLGDILPNHIVQVTADASGSQLIATSVLLLAPAPPQVEATRGTVKSIGTGSWVIAREKGSDITLLIDAQTKIAGSPKVGDTVEVLYRIDSSNANVAISIIKFERPTVPPIPDIFRFSGKVRSIEPQAWVILREAEEVKVLIDKNSKVEPGIKVGDGVEVLAQRKDDGSVVALLIVRKR